MSNTFYITYDYICIYLCKYFRKKTLEFPLGTYYLNRIVNSILFKLQSFLIHFTCSGSVYLILALHKGNKNKLMGTEVHSLAYLNTHSPVAECGTKVSLITHSLQR